VEEREPEKLPDDWHVEDKPKEQPRAITVGSGLELRQEVPGPVGDAHEERAADQDADGER